MSKTRSYCFTLNNYTEDEADAVAGIDCAYLIYGREVGESGTPHLQGYIRFKNPRSLGGMKKLIPRAHFEARKGSEKQAIDYCRKDDPEPFIKGQECCQGKRTDLTTLANDIKEHGYRDAMLANPEMCIRYHRGCKELASLYDSMNKKIKPTVHWFYGSTGTGKTYKAWHDSLELANGNEDQIYINNGTLKWFDGYHGQPYVILDDFRKEKEVSFAFILRMLDSYKMRVPVKGGFENWNPKHIYITSPEPPTAYRTDEQIEQLVRRIDEIVNFDVDADEINIEYDTTDFV